jgi:hypothetical protein
MDNKPLYEIALYQGGKGATPVLRKFFGVQAEYHWSTAGVRLEYEWIRVEYWNTGVAPFPP